MKPDLIISWPISCDYPLWRQMIRDNRERFNKVIIVFTLTHYGEDYRSFIAGAMQQDNCTFVDNAPVRGDQDWRNVAVNIGLSWSNAEWVWFTEQDFLPKEGFWDYVDDAEKNYNALGIIEGSRVHPACLFAKRDLIKKTKKDFSVLPNVADHFYKFTTELQKQTAIGIIPDDLWHHMNGLSQNYSMLFNGEKPNWKPEEFSQYLQKCLEVSVPLDPRFVEFANSVKSL